MSSRRRSNNTRAAPKQIIETPAIVLLAAAPRSGKSYTIRHMITSLCRAGVFNYGVVFSTSGKYNGDYDYMPGKYVHSEYTDQKLTAILAHQDRRRDPVTKMPPPMFIVLDDMIGQVKMDSKVFTRLITSYRHYNISVFYAAHLVTRVSTLFRECCRYCFIFRQTTKRSFEALWEVFLQDIPRDRLEEFIGRYTQKKYHYLLVKCEHDGNERYEVGCAPANEARIMLNY